MYQEKDQGWKPHSKHPQKVPLHLKYQYLRIYLEYNNLEIMRKKAFQQQIFLLFPLRNNYTKYIHIQMIHLQTLLIWSITHMHGLKTVGDEGNLQVPVLEHMEEITTHQQADRHLEDHPQKEILQELLILKEKDVREDLIGKLLIRELLEEDLQEDPQEEETMEEDHLEEDHLEEDHQEVEDPQEEVEDPQEEVEDPQEEEDHQEEEFINPKVLDLLIYPPIILIQN